MHIHRRLPDAWSCDDEVLCLAALYLITYQCRLPLHLTSHHAGYFHSARCVTNYIHVACQLLQ